MVSPHTHSQTHTHTHSQSPPDQHPQPVPLPCAGGPGPSDASDGEEAERCPICLGVLPAGEAASPDSCCHVFCLGCLLRWAEVGRVLSGGRTFEGAALMLWVCFPVADVGFLSRGQKTFQECLQMGRQPELRAGVCRQHV